MTLRTQFLAFCLFFSGCQLYAAPCEMDPGAPAQRVFAKVDARHSWTEYKTIEAVPSLSLGEGVSAELWEPRKGELLIRTVTPSQNFRAYTKSCYTGLGYLVYASYELRTAWGWYYRAEGPIVMERFHRSTAQYFDSTTNQPLVVRPQQADDNPGMLDPKLQMNTRLLPFANLLARRP